MVSSAVSTRTAEKLLPQDWKSVFEEDAMQSIFSVNESSYFVYHNRKTEQPLAVRCHENSDLRSQNLRHTRFNILITMKGFIVTQCSYHFRVDQTG